MVVFDTLGVTKLYPSSTIHPQEFVFPNRISQVTPSVLDHITFSSFGSTSTGNAAIVLFGTDNVLNWFEFDPAGDADEIKANVLTPAHAGISPVIDFTCDMSHEDAAARGYANDPLKEWLNVEMSCHFFVNEVDLFTKYVFLESRGGVRSAECCSGVAYGVRLFWARSETEKGKFAFYKREWSDSTIELPKQTQTAIPTFYQNWFGAKFILFNKVLPDGKKEVHLQLFLSPYDPTIGTTNSNSWVLVGEVIDFEGKKWNTGAGKCDGKTNDQPLTFSGKFSTLGYEDGQLIRFANLSVREIDPLGTFGEDPEPPPVDPPDPPDTDPEDPPLVCPAGQHEENGICVFDNPPVQPPDVPPSGTVSTLTKRLTIRREIINSSKCNCDGIPTGVTNPPPPPGGGGGGSGGGGGGSNTLPTIYNVPLTSSFVKLASVDDSTDYYLRYGLIVSQTNSPFIGAYIGRIEITIAEKADPSGSTGQGVYCRIRKGSDDSIAAELGPSAEESSIVNAGILWKFENLDNDYALQFGDMILFEYDGGDRDNYIKLFRSGTAPNTGTKQISQNNRQDAGEYNENADFDICMRVYKKESILLTANTPVDDP